MFTRFSRTFRPDLVPGRQKGNVRDIGCVTVLFMSLAASALADERPAQTAAMPTSAQGAPVFDLRWRPAEDVWFQPGAVLQVRYTFNHRLAGPHDGSGTSSRISLPRARLILDGGFKEYLTFRVRVGTVAGGDARFELAHVNFLLGQVTLRAGILYLPLSVGDNPTPENLQAIDYSQYGFQTGAGNVPSLGAVGEFGHVRTHLYMSSGSTFSEFSAPDPARVAITGRTEARFFTHDDFTRFDTESSYRGSDLALRVGTATHYQHGRLEPASSEGDLEQVTCDGTLETSGLNLIAAGRWLRIHPAKGNITHDFGILIQGGVFVHERIELWARYDALYSDGKVHSFPLAQNGVRRHYQGVGAGINAYLIPRSNYAKLQADVSYIPSGIASTWAKPSDNAGVAQATVGQWAVRAQFVLSF